MISIILYMAVGLLLAVGILIEDHHTERTMTLCERILCIAVMPFMWLPVVFAMVMVETMKK